jgi:SAM-dependent methyltransferase
MLRGRQYERLRARVSAGCACLIDATVPYSGDVHPNPRMNQPPGERADIDGAAPSSDRRSAADHFSSRATDYAAYRPRYPAELFAFLATLPHARELAWDCATGNGQAAIPLADYFTQVVATDLSEVQIANAESHARVEYRVAPAHASGLRSRSADLVTVAQALHWFDLDAFYAEVRRVLAPGGALAVSSYGSAVIDSPVLAPIFSRFELETLRDYWPPGRELVGEALRALPFPFAELRVPHFQLETHWTLTQLVGYSRSWSATGRFIEAHGYDPTPELEKELRASWGSEDRRHSVWWAFVVRAGREM